MNSLGFSRDEIVSALEGNQAFSSASPALQIYWDSTSLGSFKYCPRRYFYEIILGRVPRRRNVDLEFGILVHAGVEMYHRLRAGPSCHETSLREVVRWAQTTTWDSERGRPQVWDDPAKNRTGLLRLLVWYLDRWKDDPLRTLHYSDGRPMVEVQFSFASPLRSKNGQQFNFCGYFDRLGELGGDIYVADVKTSRHALDARYFTNFTPDNQFSLYSLASRIAFDRPAKGVIVDACQVGATFVRFQRELVSRSEEALEEWLEDQARWLEGAETCASELYWPMNDRMCWNCPFQPVCSRPPSARRAWLEANYVRRVWDPTRQRGDI